MDHKASFRNEELAEYAPYPPLGDKIIHRGVLNPDASKFYYTISDKMYQKFDIFYVERTDDGWSEPQEAQFNSSFSDHGMSFSLDGKTIFFSSTRPTLKEGAEKTWHIWKSVYYKDSWSEPVFLDIPKLRSKLVSHPSITESGKLYFHVSNLDYSGMDLHHCNINGGLPDTAFRVELPNQNNTPKCTPYIAPDGDYLIYASVDEDLDLYISHREKEGTWSESERLPDVINSYGKGNPYVHAGHLYYTVSDEDGSNWKVMRIMLKDALEAR